MLYPDALTELDPDTRDWIYTNEPPSTFEEALATAWRELVLWYGNEQTDEHQAAFMLFDHFAQGWGIEDLWSIYGEVAWSAQVQAAMTELVLNPEDDDVQNNREAVIKLWENEAGAAAEQTYSAFLGEVARCKTGRQVHTGTVGGLPATDDDEIPDYYQTADYAEIDWRAVEKANEAILKATDAGGDVEFIQSDDGRMIFWGDDADVTVWNAFLRKQLVSEAMRGTISVKSRGSMTSHGKIVVMGAFDNAEFKRNLRRFSKKEIQFT